MATTKQIGTRFAVDLGNVKLPDNIEKEAEAQIQKIVLRALVNLDLKGDLGDLIKFPPDWGGIIPRTYPDFPFVFPIHQDAPLVRLSQVTIGRRADGEIMGAKGINVEGSDESFTLDKGMIHRAYESKKSAFATLRFFKNNDEYLTATATIIPVRESISFHADTAGARLDFTIDFSEYDKAHQGKVEGRMNKQEFHGTFDPRTNDLQLDVKLEGWLPEEVERRVASFVPLLEEGHRYYQIKGKPYEAKVKETIQNSIWGTIGKAAAWGFAGMGTAASCVIVPGAGCAVGAALFGAAASVASDQWEGK